MNRFAPNMMEFTHRDAIEWLDQLMLDLKQMMTEPNYQPFTIEFLDEWTGKHNRDIESCKVKPLYHVGMDISDMLIPEHLDAIGCFNQIVIDLKLIVLGHEPIRAFTEDRIKEADRYCMEVANCRKHQMIWYR